MSMDSVDRRIFEIRPAALLAAALAVTIFAIPAWPAANPPRFFSYASPAGVGDDSGEPSLGSNWTREQSFTNSLGSIPNGGTANYFGGFSPYMLNVVFNDCQSPALVTWNQKPLLTASTPRAAGDPILYTDRMTGRTFVTQEEGATPAGSGKRMSVRFPNRLPHSF